VSYVKRQRLRLSERRDPKWSLSMRRERVELALMSCCGGAGLHRPECLGARSARRNGALAVHARQVRQAAAVMRAAAGVRELEEEVGELQALYRGRPPVEAYLGLAGVVRGPATGGTRVGVSA